VVLVRDIRGRLFDVHLLIVWEDDVRFSIAEYINICITWSFNFVL
jgi:hypothetical protein